MSALGHKRPFRTSLAQCLLVSLMSGRDAVGDLLYNLDFLNDLDFLHAVMCTVAIDKMRFTAMAR